MRKPLARVVQLARCMNRYVERVISHAILLLEDMVVSARENPLSQGRLREAIALLRVVADVVESVGRIDGEARAHG